MTKRSGKQGDSLNVDANGQHFESELRDMYAHWLVNKDENGENPSGVRILSTLHPENPPY
jgi:hypothetical protein